jgi:uncharacterized protein (TIGR03083 family)
MTEHPMTPPPGVDFLGQLRRDVYRLATVIAACDLTAAVPNCPGWDLRRLAIHVGNVHRWAAQAAQSGMAPPSRPADPHDDVELGAWLRAGGDALIEVLEVLDPHRPSWHPFPTDQVAAVWPRRMAHETAIHRVDAELATGGASSQAATAVEAHLASDGIDEYFSVMVAGAAQRRGLQLPASTLHVHCTDVHGEWLVWAKGSSVTVQREHAKGDVALRGPASSVFLALWGRVWPDPGIEILGDETAGRDWLMVGGV